MIENEKIDKNYSQASLQTESTSNAIIQKAQKIDDWNILFMVQNLDLFFVVFFLLHVFSVKYSSFSILNCISCFSSLSLISTHFY